MDESNVAFMNFCHFPVVALPMSQYRSCLSLLAVVALLLNSCENTENEEVEKSELQPGTLTDTTPLSDFLSLLGAESKPRFPGTDDPGLVAAGREMIYKGRLPNSQGEKLSEYFYCADCHSAEREQRLLSPHGDAQATVDFSIENDLPLLPASTFAGITDRVAYFESGTTDSLEIEAKPKSDLESAVQFCSTALARGRELNPVEMQAVLAYLFSLEWRVGDLGFRGADLAELKRRSLNRREHNTIVEDLQKRYPLRALRIRGDLPTESKSGYPSVKETNPERGHQIWSKACLHCHGAEGASQHFFGNRVSTWRKLLSLFEDGTAYRHIREGSGSENGVYMPPYPVNKLGEQEIEDLRAYITARADREKAGKNATEEAETD